MSEQHSEWVADIYHKGKRLRFRGCGPGAESPKFSMHPQHDGHALATIVDASLHGRLVSYGSAPPPSTECSADDPEATPLPDMRLPIRTYNVLYALGCRTAGDVAKLSAEELLARPNFGQVSLMDLRKTMAELGLRLRRE